MVNKKGAAEWYWIMIGIIIALVVAIVLLSMFFDFGHGIRESFDNIKDVASFDKCDKLCSQAKVNSIPDQDFCDECPEDYCEGITCT